MPPRSHQWHECNVPNRIQDSDPLALVFENDELFEAETAEFTIEDTNDFAASLLFNNEGAGAVFPQSATDLANTNQHGSLTTTSANILDNQSYSDTVYSTVARHFHVLIHSAHSLATTSVVTPTQHAQMTECKLISVTSASLPICDYSPSPSFLVADPNTSISPLEERHQLNMPDASFPVHFLNAISHSSVPRSPTVWTDCMLAYTDAPALVRAITSDLEFYRSFNRIAMGSFDLISCDQVPNLTTCSLTCCQADVEVVEGSCGQIQDIPIHANLERLRMSERFPIKLCAFSGLRPDQSTTAMTAIYLILVEEDKAYANSSQPFSWDTDLFVLAMLVCCIPSSVQSVSQIPFLNIDHPWIRPMLCHIESGTKLVPLLALVDIVSQLDADGTNRHKAILHQRLHNLTDFSFTLSTSHSNTIC